MGRSILHRKVMQNRRRERDPEADHLMAATHYNSDAYDDFVEARDNPPKPEPIVQIKASEMDALLARLAALERHVKPYDGDPASATESGQPSDDTPAAGTRSESSPA